MTAEHLPRPRSDPVPAAVWHAITSIPHPREPIDCCDCDGCDAARYTAANAEAHSDLNHDLARQMRENER